MKTTLKQSQPIMKDMHASKELNAKKTRNQH